MKKIFLLIILLILFVGASGRSPLRAQEQAPQQADVPRQEEQKEEQYDVALLKSAKTIDIFGKYGAWEHEGAVNTLCALGLKYKVISDEELETLPLNFKLVIIPNARCLSKKAADNLRQYLANDGKLFACYLTGYRDEKNQLIGTVNNFHISDIIGADFYRWTNKPPKCEYLEVPDNLPDFKDKYVQLARNTAALIKPRLESKVIAYFLDTNKRDYSDIKDYSAAIVINKDNNAIYCGENLFAPENGSSAQVKKLIAVLINQLAPNLVDINNPEIYKSKINYFLPYKSQIPVSPAGPVIRVLLGSSYFKICVSSEDELFIKEKNENGGVLARALPGELIYIEPVYVYGKVPYIAIYDKNKELVAKTISEVCVEASGPQRIINLVKLNENETYLLKSYRGRLIVKQGREFLRCYNFLTLDEYTAGVVPNEMPYYYPKEALKAMATVARTFALSNLGRHGKEGYDVCPTVHCQVYEGVITETDQTNEAVNETTGEYISYNGKYAYATFHSNCGGVLEDVELVWPGHKASPYLRASFDQPDSAADEESPAPDLSVEENFKNFINNSQPSFCVDLPRYRWKEKYAKGDLEKLLNESLPVILNDKYVNLGELVDIKTGERTKHGRVQELKIIGSRNTYTLYKDELRWMTSGGKISTGGLQSTLFYVQKDGDNYIFCGGGWGHGVGMCQSGAQGMAKAGYNYRDIIKHYYNGVEIGSRGL